MADATTHGPALQETPGGAPLGDLKGAAIRGVAWSSIDTWGQQALSFGIFAVLARLLGPDSFGLVALAGVYVAFLDLFVKQGFGAAIIQRRQLDRAHLDTAFLISIILSAGLCLATLVLAHPVAMVFGEPKLAAILGWLSLSLVFGALSGVPSAILMREMRFRSLAIRSLAATSVGGGAGIAMALWGFGAWSLVGQQLVGAFVGVACLWWATHWVPRWSWSRQHFRDLFGFSWSLLGNGVLWFFCQRSDQAIVGRFLGTLALGQYALANRVVQLLRDSIVAPLSTVALPAFSSLQDDTERLMRSYYRLTECSALIGFPLFAGLIAVAPEGIPLLLGAQWTPAVLVAQLLAVTGLLHVAFIGTHPLTLAKGKPVWCLGLNALHAGGTIVAAILGLRWGISGVAAGLAINWAANAVIGLLVLRRVLDIGLARFARCFVVPSMASLVMLAVVIALRSALIGQFPPIAVAFSCVTLGVLTYGAALLIVRPAAAQDLLRAVASRRSSATAP